MAGTGGITWVCPGHLYDGRQLRAGRALGVSGGKVVALADAARLADDAVRIDIAGIVTPGFVDLQVNGGGGLMVNANPTPQAMAGIAAAHHRLGTVAILPTVISDTPEILSRAVEAAIAAKGQKGIAGLHIEGPHISVPRRGTHAEHFIRPLDMATIGHVRRLREAGVPVMLTLAPEAATDAQIGELAALGAVVSVGHSDVSADRAEAAFVAGASAVTHLFNAMSPMENRAPGLTGAAINSEVFAGIICDGIHVDDRMVGLAFRARPVPNRMFLVSDAMPTVGGPDHFSLYGQDIARDGDRLVNSEGSLAGAHTTMAVGVARLVGVVGVDRETALRAAILVPSSLMGLGLDRIDGRAVDDLIVLDDKCVLRGPLSVCLGQGANSSLHLH